MTATAALASFLPGTTRPGRMFRQGLAAALLARPAGAEALADPLRPILASLLAGRALEEGVLPASLGLAADDLGRLWRDYFPGPRLALADGGGEDIPELGDIVGLLLDYRAGRRQSEAWLALSIGRACAGGDHLWQDLGLANRGELSALMTGAFPALAALNTGDMKWKKFLYRQYCARDGIYVCPAPSCGECADYAKCFAPED